MRGDFDEDELDEEDFDETDPVCSDCGCDLFTEQHAWDCAFADDDFDDEDEDHLYDWSEDEGD